MLLASQYLAAFDVAFFPPGFSLCVCLDWIITNNWRKESWLNCICFLYCFLFLFFSFRRFAREACNPPLMESQFSLRSLCLSVSPCLLSFLPYTFAYLSQWQPFLVSKRKSLIYSSSTLSIFGGGAFLFCFFQLAFSLLSSPPPPCLSREILPLNKPYVH